MHLQLLNLQNFRGFAGIVVVFKPEFNLLIGDNGSGKTALLAGAAMALSTFLQGFEEGVARQLSHDQVRRVVYEHEGLPDLQAQYPCMIGCQARLSDHQFLWWLCLLRPRGRTRFKTGQEIQQAAAALRDAVRRGEPVDLPVLAFYGTQRVWMQKRQKDAGPGRAPSRLDGYLDCLDPASNHKHLSEWMRRQALAAAQRGEALPHLQAVARAVETCIEGSSRFYYDLLHEELRLGWEDGRLTSFDMLSDGYRNMVAVVADIAWRAAMLNPHHGAEAAQKATGVVLIDEIDLHLHPSWQRRVVGDLRRTFPNLQFIATTHSPQVLASARREWVQRIDGEKVSPVGPVEGLDSNTILEEVLGGDARPPEGETDRSALFAHIDAREFDAARALLGALEERWGADYPDLVRARWMLQAEGEE